MTKKATAIFYRGLKKSEKHIFSNFFKFCCT
jgi:hypothetical protein